MQRCRYAMGKLDELPKVNVPFKKMPHFTEFVMDFSKSGKTVAEVNQALLDCDIFGGVDLSESFPSLGGSAIFCVTEVHTKDDIDRLVSALEEVLK